MIKTAAFTDEISHDLAHACDVCIEFGVEGAELRGVNQKGVHTWTDAEVREAKRIIADHGMVTASIGSPFGKCELTDADEVAAHMDILRRCGDIANELGCGLVRGFAFWGHGSANKPWDDMLRAFDPVPQVLADKGVVLGLENEAACYVGTAQDTRHFLDRLGCDHVRAIWDPANHIQDPHNGDLPTFPDGYQLIKDDIVHVHVKDAIVTPEERPNVFLGEGLAQWNAQFQMLKDDGYDGFVSLETHVNPDRFPPEMQAKYGQYLTGEGREPASKVCLAWIRDALGGLS
jgi:sugar phosphate isomerase/epimerase